MLVDGLSYIGNLMAECTTVPRTKKRVELTMSGVSLTLLFGFTAYFVKGSIDAIQAIACNCTTDETTGIETCVTDDSNAEVCVPEEGVNAYIVMGFALGGLLFDGLSLFAYKAYSHEDVDDLPIDPLDDAAAALALSGSVDDNENSGSRQNSHNHNNHKHHHHLGDHPLTHHHNDDVNHVVPSSTNVNMMSALMHVFSDLLRSTTTLVESIVLFQYPNISSNVIDGWCTLIICSLIGVGAVWSILIWFKEVFRFCVEKEEDEDEEGETEEQRYKALISSV
jgi:hypothetical protein